MSYLCIEHRNPVTLRKKNSFHLVGRLLDGIREGVKWTGTEVFELLAPPTQFMD